MLNVFSEYKKQIDKQNNLFKQDLCKIKLPWSSDFFSKLYASSINGKSIRGSLILLSQEMFGQKIGLNSLYLALALEYAHTALLIHDDIMDHDHMRRGLPSMHHAFYKTAKDNKVKDPMDFGVSQAICLGDAAIFSAQFAFSKIDNLAINEYKKLLSLLSLEFIKVGLGQAQDLKFTHYPETPSLKEVLEMYTYKTARYTFSLPLMAGAIMAGRPDHEVEILDKIGIDLGLIFQLSDDNLSLHGTADKTGKAVGNDIKENKKIYYRILLLEKASKKDRDLVQKIFTRGKADNVNVDIIKKLVLKYKIDALLDDLINKHNYKVLSNLKKIDITDDYREIIDQFLIFLKKRQV